MTIPALPDVCWPIDPACLTDTWEQVGTEVQQRSVALATATLRRLTAGRVGGCPITVRPCAQDRPQLRRWYMPATLGWSPLLWNGEWFNCGCNYPCRCATACEVLLPGYVGRVDEVKIAGAVLDRTTYKIVNHDRIAWQGTGDCPFPKRQDMSKPLGQANTFSVTYLPAHEPDGLAAYAAGVLAVEFSKACTGGKCRLPKGTTAVVRQGVSISIVPDSFPDGRTGIQEVDAWIEVWNPNALKRAPQVWSPDMPEVRVES